MLCSGGKRSPRICPVKRSAVQMGANCHLQLDSNRIKKRRYEAKQREPGNLLPRSGVQLTADEASLRAGLSAARVGVSYR